MTRSLQVLAVAALGIFWALNWPMMKIGLTVVEPWTFRAVVVAIGGIGCLALARAFRETLAIPRRDLVPLLWLTLFQGVIWNAFSGFGIALVDAGRASVLAFTMPVWATLLSILVMGEAVTRRRLAGLGLGMAAMGLLLVPALSALGGELFGALLMIGGAMSWAVATIIVRAVDWEMSVLALSGWQFVLGAIPLSLAAAVLGTPATLADLDAASGAALAYSAIVPMTFGQVIWFTVVRRLPTSLASMGTLMVPPLGVYFSVLILGETAGPFELAALLLVIIAMVLVLPGFNWRASLHPPPASRPE
ncbi:MAG: DMT family transporter [Pseudomonadota bacterium]